MSAQKERWAARAAKRAAWADSAEAKAATLTASQPEHATDGAFMSQPGRIPGRARLIARQDRAMELRQQANQHRAKAERLNAMACRERGDAERDRQVRRDAQTLQVGQQVVTILYGPAEVVKINTKTVRVRRLATGSLLTVDKSHLKAA